MTRTGFLLLALTAIGVSGVRAQQVTRTEIAPNMWRIDGAVDVIVAQTGEDGLLIIDTGYPFAAEGVRTQLREIAGTDQAQLLLNTHWHHTFANHLYGAEAEVIAHDNVARRMAGTNLMGGQIVPPMPAAGRPDRTFRDSLTLKFNGENITLRHFPNVHTDGDAIVIFPESNVVVTGFAVPHLPWVDWNAGGHFDSLVGAVEWLLKVVPEDAVIVPGHDETMTYDDLRAWRDMLVQSRAIVRERMEAGMSLRRIKTLGVPQFAAWQGGVPESYFLESIYRSLVPVRRNPHAPTLALENGRWFDGVGFVEKPMYAVAGVLTEQRPAAIDSTVDLEEGWVVPPFGEGHTHRLSSKARLATEGEDFLRDGVFYAMVQDPSHAIGEAHRRASADVTRVDVAYTQGVVAPSWNVIADMYHMFAERGMYGEGVTFDQLDGDVIFTLDTVDEVEALWPALEARNDRFIKIIVAFSDEVERRRDDRETFGAQPPQYSARPGVTPEVLRAVIAKAHAAGLRVSAHIETAADFRLAVAAGADLIAHMPASWQIGEGTGYGAQEVEPWLLAPEDAMAARRAGTAVITTLMPSAADDPRADLFRTVHEKNLRTLNQTGVTLVVGSDLFAGTSVDELFYLQSLGVLDAAALLQLIAVQTPRVIFPDRQIGHLREGFEASFLVLGGNPLEDLAHVRDIGLRVKNGEVLR